jgi:hypothetical protein
MLLYKGGFGVNKVAILKKKKKHRHTEEGQLLIASGNFLTYTKR